MAKGKLSNLKYVTKGYGQVEPNHLSAQRTGQIYAQLPAASSINILENGQFVKYDYAARNGNDKVGIVDFTGAGEWMLVFNEVKVYRDWQGDQDFAMIRDNYGARIYSPISGEDTDYQTRYYGPNAKRFDEESSTSPRPIIDGSNRERATTAADPYEIDSTIDPFHIGIKAEAMDMPANTVMVPRVFKTNVGDIFTTNTIDEEGANLHVGDVLSPRAADGVLVKVASGADPDMQWQIVKIYTMPDHQPGVKLMRIK